MDRIDGTIHTRLVPPHKSKPKKDGIRLSEVGYCMRRMGYGALGYEGTPKSVGVSLTFAIGNFVEDVVVKALELADFEPYFTLDKQTEVSINVLRVPNLGHPDGFVILPDTEEDVLLEVKSANARNFEKVKKSGAAEAQPEHYAQMQTYMYATGRAKAFYVVACKNYADVYTEIVDIDLPYLSALFDKVDGAWIKVQEDELPDPEYHLSSYQCTYCPFNAQCPGKQLAGGSPFIVG